MRRFRQRSKQKRQAEQALQEYLDAIGGDQHLADLIMDYNAAPMNPYEEKENVLREYIGSIGSDEKIAELMMDYAISAGADDNYGMQEMKDVSGEVRIPYEKAFVYAARRGDNDLILYLLDEGFVDDLNIMAGVAGVGTTALLEATTRGFIDTMELLIDLGADVNQTDQKNDWTPLMWASFHGNVHAVEILLDAGADVNYVNRRGWSALRIAERRGLEDNIHLLIDAGAHH